MTRQHLTRRIVLSAVMFSLAVLATVGGGDSALADISTGDHYGSAGAFKKDCEDAGGSFADSPVDGLTICAYPDGAVKACNRQGNNCVLYPPKQQEPTSWANPAIDATVDAAITDDTQTVAPVDARVDAPLVLVTETPVEAPMESQGASAAEFGTLAAPVEAPVTLIEEPVAVEEPMVAEAGAEQP